MARVFGAILSVLRGMQLVANFDFCDSCKEKMFDLKYIGMKIYRCMEEGLMKKVVSLLLVVAMAFAMVGCGSSKKTCSNSLKVGIILVGDETEGNSKAHIAGIRDAAKKLGIEEKSLIWKYKIAENDQCTKTAEELVAQGCNLIIANSAGHQDFLIKTAEKYKDVNFVNLAGNNADVSGLENFYNAFTNIYEARYVSGVVAGMKVKNLVDTKKMPASSVDPNGNVKIGYIGTFSNAENISGYTAFFLGIKSVYEKVAMEVEYTNAASDDTKEKAAAEKLIKDHCVIVGQHADSTAAPIACQKAIKAGKKVYSVGFGEDMLPVAKKAALTSPISDWSVYFTELFQNSKDEQDISQDWCQGLESGAVGITKLGPKVAPQTAEQVERTIAAIKDGQIQVFDTQKFTVKGQTVESAQIDLSYVDYAKNKVIYEGDKKEAISDGTFQESTLRSAPYFNLKIDGITEVNAK